MEEEEFEEDIKEETEEQEEDSNKKVTYQGKGILKYDNDEVVNIIFDERNKETPSNWAKISRILKEKGYSEITPAQCKKMYTSAITRTVTLTKTGGKKFTDYTERLNSMYSQYISVLQRWINAADNLTKTLEENSNGAVEPLQASIMIMKLSPQMKQVQEEIRLAMEFNRKQQEMIKIEQKNSIFSEDDIRNKLFEQLDRLEKEGRIVWKKK
ncbi:MAG: hypothetical protein PHS54_07185 [Clostridia bacterium]|nr:hypothetical protein [Clostridia bacterium]